MYFLTYKRVKSLNMFENLFIEENEYHNGKKKVLHEHLYRILSSSILRIIKELE